MTRPRRLVRLAALAAILLALLAGIEKVGRNFPRLMPPQWQRLHGAIERAATAEKPIPDAEIGFLPRPGPESDSKGFPNKEPWPERASIVFLGDSLLQGTGNFTTLVRRLLPDQPVINLGLGAAGVERQMLLFERFGAPLRPRLVVACLYLAADFENDSRFRSWVREGHGEDFSTYRIPGDNGAYVSPMVLFRTLQWNRLLEQSWMYVKARELAIEWTKGADAIEDRYRFPDGTETLLSRKYLEFANAQTHANDPRIAALMESLAKLRALATEHDASLLVVLIPSFEELFRGRPDAQKGNVLAHTRARLAADGFSVLDLYPSLQLGGRLQTAYHIDDIHLNAYGNHIVAHEFVAWFEQRRLDDGRFAQPSAIGSAATR